MPRQPLISLAMIVKNEATRLGRLLAEHAALYDEAVVADTGSTDGTPVVARRGGARVLATAWRDDFSAARNTALDACRGRWILVLDADERIAATDQAVLRRLVTDASPCGVILPQWNLTDETGLPDWRPVDPRYLVQADGALGYVPAHAVRLFPNDPRVRYRGLVHESVDADLRELGWPFRCADVPIHHLGHRASGARQVRRKTRNGRLLRRKLKQKPECPGTRREMAVQLIEEGRDDLAQRLLMRTVSEAPGGLEVPRARRLLARLLAHAGQPAAAAAQLDLALRERPDWVDAWIDAVRLHLALEDRDLAATLVERGRWLFPLDTRLAALQAQVSASQADIRKAAGTG